jgi:hypothetical protein
MGAEGTMIRYLVAVTIAGALVASAAHAQSPDTDDNRYQLNRVDDGYLRLDLKSGQLSLCNRREVGWACRAVPDERAALDGEIARLQNENAALKKSLLDRGLPLPGAATTVPPVADNGDSGGSDLKVPRHADIDRMMAAVERAWRRLIEMFANLQKDLMKKT